MGQKNQFNMYDTGDLPVSSIKDLKVEQVKSGTQQQKISKTRFKKAAKPTQDLPEEEELKPFNNKKNTNKKSESEPKQVKKKINKEEAIENADLEALNEQNILQHRFRSRRNKVIMYILISLLVVAVTVIAVYITLIRLKNTCFLHVNGADAVYIVDGEELSEFRAPQGIKGNSYYQFDLDLKINSSGNFNVKFKIDIYQDGVLIDNIIAYPETTGGIFRKGEDEYYYSTTKVAGNQTINLCQGVLIDSAYEDTLNIDNFRMNIYTYLY